MLGRCCYCGHPKMEALLACCCAHGNQPLLGKHGKVECIGTIVWMGNKHGIHINKIWACMFVSVCPSSSSAPRQLHIMSSLTGCKRTACRQLPLRNQSA